MSRETPRRIDELLLQLGSDASGITLDPDITYTAEDLTFYLPSRRTRLAGSIQNTAAAGGRRSLVEFSGIPRGGTWIEFLANRSPNAVQLFMNEPGAGTSITNDRVDGWEFACTPFFDEVFLGGLFIISDDVLPWSSQLANGSIISNGTTSNVPIFFNGYALAPGAVFPSSFWIPPNWRLAVIAAAVLSQINNLDYVLSLPPLGGPT